MRAALVTACLLSVTFAGAAEEYDRDSALRDSQAAIGRALGEHRLRDRRGQAFALSQLKGRPAVISMVYSSCHHVCPTITRSLADAVGKARDALGEDSFAVVSIGFDCEADTPERMGQFATQHGVAREHAWYFLSCDPATIQSLAEDLGFLFYPSVKGFDHLAQTTVVDRDGVIYRQVYGATVATQALVEPLKELVFDTPGSESVVTHWVNTLKLFCTVYDPNSDRYRFDYSIFVGILVGVLCLGSVAAFVIREWKSAR